MGNYLDELLKEYYNYEGWHGVYKKHWHQVKHNYKLKHKLKKRFGDNRKQALRNGLKDVSFLFRDIPYPIYGTSIIVQFPIDK